jgi:uncharacterized lipoprotein YmbA
MSDRIDRDVAIVERTEWAVKLPPMLREIGARVYSMEACRIIVSRDPPQAERPGWHLSISRRDSDPTWNEIATARYRLLPDVREMAMYLPSLAEYVNLHPYTFHLHEVEPSRIVIAR